MYKHGRDTENRTLVFRVRAEYFSTKLYPHKWYFSNRDTVHVSSNCMSMGPEPSIILPGYRFLDYLLSTGFINLRELYQFYFIREKYHIEVYHGIEPPWVCTLCLPDIDIQLDWSVANPFTRCILIHFNMVSDLNRATCGFYKR